MAESVHCVQPLFHAPKEATLSDNNRPYRTVRNALDRFYPHPQEGNLARHLNTLAAFIHGIVRSKRTHLSAIAQGDPTPIQLESRIKRLSRFVQNEQIELEVYFAPYARVVLASLAMRPLQLVIDGSEVGRWCAALMLSGVYRQRALPLGWLVRTGKKGHFSEAMHLELLVYWTPKTGPLIKLETKWYQGGEHEPKTSQCPVQISGGPRSPEEPENRQRIGRRV